MSDLLLSDIVLVIHESLESVGLAHAFGGALALGYCTPQARGTKDIDLNVFVGPRRYDDVLAALPDRVVATDRQRRQLSGDAQTRVWWDETPIDVFLSSHPFHGKAELRTRRVPFAGIELPVLSCADLAVFKVFFARPKDLVDIATMVSAASVDHGELTHMVRSLLGDDRDEFLERIREMAAEIAE